MQPPVRHTGLPGTASLTPQGPGPLSSNGALVPSGWTTAASATPVLVESADVHKKPTDL